ncbi:SHOCT domain-containing protein [Clostridioides difficile]
MSIITSSKSTEDKKESISSSTADEILKYKNLLDIEAITQEEFDAKKKELLNL